MSTSPVHTPLSTAPLSTTRLSTRPGVGLVEEAGDLLAGEGWHVFGACNGMDLDLFFPERGESTTEAKTACADCIVATECLEYALANNERYGIWGGTSGRERRRLRRRRGAAAA